MVKQLKNLEYKFSRQKTNKIREEIATEAKWKDQDHPPVIPLFTADVGVHAEILENRRLLVFLNILFFDNEF